MDLRAFLPNPFLLAWRAIRCFSADPLRTLLGTRRAGLLLLVTPGLVCGPMQAEVVDPAPSEEPASDPAPQEEPDGAAAEEDGEGWTPAEAPAEDPPSDPAEPGEPSVPAEGAGVAGSNPLPVEQRVGQGVVFGEVSDATTLDPIAGAIVTVIGTGREAETDAQGRFRIDGLPSGDYTVEALKLGYSTGTSAASPRPGSEVELRIALRVKATDQEEGEYMLAEETVVGEYTESGQADFELSLELGQNIGSGLDKSEFTKSGVSDAAGAVSKIAGANIVGGRYAVVRGLGDRYSNTTVNGALISSADPSRKAVQLDLFPSDLLESINIYKTFTPDYPGEFAGGLVAINTLAFPEQPIVEFEYGVGYNSNLDGGDFYAMPGRDLGLLGKTDDSLGNITPLEDGGLSRGWSSSRPPNLNNPAQAEAAAEGVQQWGALHQSGGMRPVKDSSELGHDLSLTLGRTFEFDNGVDLGFVAAGIWGSEDEVVEDVEVGRTLNNGADGISGTDDDRLEREQTENIYTRSAGYGLLGSLGLRSSNDRHEISYTFFQNHRGEDTVQRGRILKDESSEFRSYLTSNENSYGAGAYTYVNFDSLIPLQRTLTLNQLVGRHAFGDEERPIELDWAMSRSRALEERANTRTLFYTELDHTDPRIRNEEGDVYRPDLGVVYIASDPFLTNPPANESFRESLTTAEEAGNERLDVTFPAWKGSDGNFLSFSAGGNHFNRDREVRGRLFTNRMGTSLIRRLNQDGNYAADYLDSYDSLYEPDGTPKFDGWSGNSSRSDKLIWLEQSNAGRTVRNVNAATDLTAGYLMTSASLAGWDLVGGVRYEGETRSYEVPDFPLNPFFAETGGVVSEDSAYWLPGIVLSRDFGATDQFGFTLGWSKTVARPTFYEFAPVITEDQASGDVIEGNPDLRDTQINNFDLRVDWRPQPGTNVGLSLFHKNMTDPIAQAYELGRKTWVNGEEGSLQGVEFELGHQFLEHWSVNTNYTYIDSSLVYLQQRGNVLDEISSTFEGQPNHIFNLNFGYDNLETGWAANLVYNFTGSYLTGVPLSEVNPPIRRESYSLLDLIVQKRFDLWEGVGIVKLKFGNLLDSVDREIFDGTGLVYESYKPGRSVGLSFKFEY